LGIETPAGHYIIWTTELAPQKWTAKKEKSSTRDRSKLMRDKRNRKYTEEFKLEAL